MPNTDPPIDSPELLRSVRETAAAQGARAGGQPRSAHTRPRRRAADGDGRAARAGRARLHRRRAPGGERRSAARSAPAPARVRRHDRAARGGSLALPRGRDARGALSAELGIPGIPCSSEASMVARDAVLAGSEGARVHFQHLSCTASVEAVAAAKAGGAAVSAEATPHHLLLTEEAVRGIRKEVGVVGVDGGGVEEMVWSGHAHKDEPPARNRGRPQGAGRGAASGHDRLRRHRPRAARAGGEGAAVHRGPDGDDRSGDGVRRALHRAGAAGGAGPGGAARTDDRRRRAVRAPRPDDRARARRPTSR